MPLPHKSTPVLSSVFSYHMLLSSSRTLHRCTFDSLNVEQLLVFSCISSLALLLISNVTMTTTSIPHFLDLLDTCLSTSHKYSIECALVLSSIIWTLPFYFLPSILTFIWLVSSIFCSLILHSFSFFLLPSRSFISWSFRFFSLIYTNMCRIICICLEFTLVTSHTSFFLHFY